MPSKFPEQLVKQIKMLAENECHLDDKGMDILDLAGISFDDSYNIGFNDGQVALARRLVAELKDNGL